jgi:glucosamine-6-phosphate deaminase
VSISKQNDEIRLMPELNMEKRAPQAILTGKTDRLRWEVYEDRKAMGLAAAIATAKQIRAVLKAKGSANIIFATAPSQNEFLAPLLETENLDWARVNAFHQDEYAGLPEDSPERFSAYFHGHIASKVRLGGSFTINGNAEAGRECARYAGLLETYPVDICCGGIGENGHIAFNDPHVADFSDPVAVKEVSIDEVCRTQQIHDGCFKKIEDVPRRAITLTVPALMRAPSVVVIVPSATKAEAVGKALTAPISSQFPATVYRRHPSAVLYLERASARLMLG